MKIFDHTVPSTCIFGDLTLGDVFKSKDDFLYMKTNTLSSDIYDDDAEEYNAILLSSGESAYFCFDEEVCRVEATLTITPFIPFSRWIRGGLEPSFFGRKRTFFYYTTSPQICQ